MKIFSFKNFNELVAKKNIVAGLMCFLFGIAVAISTTNHFVSQYWERRVIVQAGLFLVATLFGCSLVSLLIYRYVWPCFKNFRGKEQIFIIILSFLLGGSAFQLIQNHIPSPTVNNTLEITSLGSEENKYADVNFKIEKIRINGVRVSFNKINYDKDWTEQNGKLVVLGAGRMNYEFKGQSGDRIEILLTDNSQSGSISVRINGYEESFNLSDGHGLSYTSDKKIYFMVKLNPLVGEHLPWFLLLYGSDVLTLSMMIWVTWVLIALLIQDGTIKDFILKAKYKYWVIQTLYQLKYQISGALLQITGYIYITRYFFQRNFLDYTGFGKNNLLETVLGITMIMGGILLYKRKWHNDEVPAIKSNIVFIWLPLLILGFYAWTAYSSNTPNRENYFGYLSQAFLAKQAYFFEQPNPKLLALADPYDPKQNGPYRLHCASLYKGKYYLYNGPINTVLFYVPYLSITNNFLPNDLAVTMFGGGGFLFGVLSLYLIRKKYFPTTSLWGMALCIITIGLSNNVAFLVRRPIYIEIAVLGGFFWANVAIFLYILYLSVKPARLSIIGLAALAYAFAFGARIDYVFGSVIFVIPLWLIYIENKNKISNSKIFNIMLRYLLIVGLPLASIGVLYLWYNYVRFDNIFEFGQAYVLDSVKPSLWVRSIDQIPYNAYIYFFNPPKIDLFFPFFHLQGAENLPAFIRPHSTRYYDGLPNLGWFPNAPFLLLILLLSFFSIFVFIYRIVFRGKALDINNLFRNRVFVILVMIILIPLGNIFIIFTMNTHILRYQLDLLPYLLLMSCIGYMHFEKYLQNFGLVYKRAFRLIAVTAVVYSAVLNVCISFTGEEPLLMAMSPVLYSRMKNSFDIIPALNSIYTKTDDVRLIISQPYYWEKTYEAEVPADKAQFLLSNKGIKIEIFAFKKGLIVLSPSYIIKTSPATGNYIKANVTGLDGVDYQKSFEVWPKADIILLPVRQGKNLFNLSYSVHSNTNPIDLFDLSNLSGNIMKGVVTISRPP